MIPFPTARKINRCSLPSCSNLCLEVKPAVPRTLSPACYISINLSKNTNTVHPKKCNINCKTHALDTWIQFALILYICENKTRCFKSLKQQYHII